jgi:hypothetical protein
VAARTLNNPLYLSLARDIYRGGDTDPTELIKSDRFQNEEALRQHLLEGFVDLSYRARPDREKEAIISRLAWIARQMGTSRDLRWWQIPTWIPARHLRLAAGLAFGLAGGLAFGLAMLTFGFAAGLKYGPEFGIEFWLIFGLGPGLGGGIISGLMAVLGLELESKPGREPHTLEPRWLSRGEIRDVLGVALGGGLALGSLFWLITREPAAALAIAFIGLLGMGLGRLMDFWAAPVPGSPAATPVRAYRASKRKNVIAGLEAALFLGTVGGLSFGITHGLPAGLMAGLVVGPLFGLTVSQASGSTGLLRLTEAVLLLRWQRSRRFMPLLEDALDRQILYQAGAVYQFRHADLQDHLAARHPEESAGTTTESRDRLNEDRLNTAADRLAENMRAYWQEQATRRRIVPPAPTVAMCSRWALSEAHPAGKAKGLASDVVMRLHEEVYLQLPRRRLVIHGGPGAGKTAAMILLLLAALDHRRGLAGQQRANAPVPVWLTAGGWNPATTPVRAWARETMNRDHPYLRAREHGPDAADELLRAGRVALFLDGLDEMPASARDQLLKRLREEASGLCVVMTSRTDQLREALATKWLGNAAVIELCPVQRSDAANYLLHDQAGAQRDRWEQVCDHLEEHPDSIAARALDNPLTLSLARDTYQHDDPTALIDASSHATEEQLRGHLLARLLAHAYPDQDEQDKATSRLAWIAHHMGTNRDLPWWHIPTWIPAWQIRLTAGLAVGLANVLTLWLPLGLVVGNERGLAVGLASVLAVGLPIGLVFGLWVGLWVGLGKEHQTLDPRWPRWHETFRILAWGLAFGFPVWLLIWIREGVTDLALPGIGCAIGCAIGLTKLWRAPGTRSSAATPLSTYVADWHAQLLLGLVVGLLVGPAAGVSAGLASGLTVGLASGLASGLTVGLTVGLVFGSASVLRLTEVALLFQGRGLGRFMPLLEGALDRQVLQQTGAVYQFRHAELQDHLAAMRRQRTASPFSV